MAKTSHELAIEFAVEITELCSRIKGQPEYTKQLIRSASSISANRVTVDAVLLFGFNRQNKYITTIESRNSRILTSNQRFAYKFQKEICRFQNKNR